MTRGYNIFEVNLARKWPEISAGKEVIVELQSLDKGSNAVVRAIIAKAKDMPDGVPLGVVSDDGRIKDEKWAIKILEELDPDDVEPEPPADLGAPVPSYG